MCSLLQQLVEENILCGECAVVHEEDIHIACVVNKEGSMAGRHHMPRLFV